MSDVSLSLQQQITQAIAQLSKSAPGNTLLQKGVEVLVQRLAGNQLIFADNKGQRQVQLDKQNLQGTLLPGRAYRANIEVNNTQTLLSFLPLNKAATESPPLANLTSSQLQQAVKAIGGQLSGMSGSKPLILEAKVTQITGRRINLEIKVGQQPLNVNVEQPKGAAPLLIGQKVKVALTPVNNTWQVKLLAQPDMSPAPSREVKSSPSGTLPSQGAQLLKLDNKYIPDLLRSGLSNTLNKNIEGPVLEVPRHALHKLAEALPSIIPPCNHTQIRWRKRQ